MDFWTAFQALILGVVEGITEFLPISSTGHQIIVADLIGFGGDRAKAFNIIIQLGAILAVDEAMDDSMFVRGGRK